jgi:hypothetical protein
MAGSATQQACLCITFTHLQTPPRHATRRYDGWQFGFAITRSVASGDLEDAYPFTKRLIAFSGLDSLTGDCQGGSVREPGTRTLGRFMHFCRNQVDSPAIALPATCPLLATQLAQPQQIADRFHESRRDEVGEEPHPTSRIATGRPTCSAASWRTARWVWIEDDPVCQRRCETPQIAPV